MSRVRVIQGEALDVLAGLEPGSVDSVITDPPYSSGGMFRADRVNASTDEKYTLRQHQGKRPDFCGDNMDQRSWASWCREWLGLALRAAGPGGNLCVFTDWRQLPTLTDCVQHAGWVWRGVLTWDKTEAAKGPHTGYFGYQAEFIVWATKGAVRRRPSLAQGGEGRLAGVFRKAVSKSDKHRQTAKPTPVMRWLVRCAPPGALVLDPFAGSGTTGVACVLEGRDALLVEKVAGYAELARRRVALALAEVGGAAVA